VFAWRLEGNVSAVAAISRVILADLNFLPAILQILSLTLFERVPLSQIVTAFPEQDLLDDPCNHLSLFDL